MAKDITQPADYLMVLPTQHYRIDGGHVALESAFAHHLRLLRSKIGSLAGRLVIVSPGMAEGQYEASKPSLEVMDEEEEKPPRFLAMVALVAFVVAAVILVFFGIGYLFGRAYL